MSDTLEAAGLVLGTRVLSTVEHGFEKSYCSASVGNGEIVVPLK